MSGSTCPVCGSHVRDGENCPTCGPLVRDLILERGSSAPVENKKKNKSQGSKKITRDGK